jgi:hypothetical protein
MNLSLHFHVVPSACGHNRLNSRSLDFCDRIYFKIKRSFGHVCTTVFYMCKEGVKEEGR